MPKLEKLHLHHLQLYAFGSIGQHALQKLLMFMTLKSGIVTSTDPCIALSELFQQKKNELKNISNLFTNSANLDVVYKDFEKDILQSSIDISKFDTSALIDMLQGIDIFSTSNPSFRNSFICKDKVNHQKECCGNCDHKCPVCNKNKCTKKCCMTNSRCSHKCKQCNSSHHDCTNNRYVCCKICSTCLNCFMRSKGLNSCHQLLRSVIENNTIINCPEQELRLALSIIIIFRNVIMHLTESKCQDMNNGLFYYEKLPSFCNTWDALRDTYWYVIETIFKYLEKNKYITNFCLVKHKESLSSISNFLNKTELVEAFGNAIQNYGALEQCIADLKEEVKELNSNIQSVRDILELKPLTLYAEFTFPEHIGFNLNSTEAGLIESTFEKAVEGYMGAKQGDNTFEALMPGFRPSNSTQLDVESVVLEFCISPKSPAFVLNDFKKFKLEKSQELWTILQGAILAKFPGTAITCGYWKLGSIIIRAIVCKKTGDKWTEEEMMEVHSEMPWICEQVEGSYEWATCTCKESRQIAEDKNVTTICFEIRPLSLKLEEEMKNFDCDVLLLYLHIQLQMQYSKQEIVKDLCIDTQKPTMKSKNNEEHEILKTFSSVKRILQIANDSDSTEGVLNEFVLKLIVCKREILMKIFDGLSSRSVTKETSAFRPLRNVRETNFQTLQLPRPVEVIGVAEGGYVKELIGAKSWGSGSSELGAPLVGKDHQEDEDYEGSDVSSLVSHESQSTEDNSCSEDEYDEFAQQVLSIDNLSDGKKYEGADSSTPKQPSVSGLPGVSSDYIIWQQRLSSQLIHSPDESSSHITKIELANGIRILDDIIYEFRKIRSCQLSESRLDTLMTDLEEINQRIAEKYDSDMMELARIRNWLDIEHTRYSQLGELLSGLSDSMDIIEPASLTEILRDAARDNLPPIIFHSILSSKYLCLRLFKAIVSSIKRFYG